MEEFRSCYYPLYNISRRCARFPFLFIHSFAYLNDVHTVRFISGISFAIRRTCVMPRRTKSNARRNANYQ